MSEDTYTSKNLQLSYIAPAQAMKHITVNESFRALDALVQMAVISQDISGSARGPC